MIATGSERTRAAWKNGLEAFRQASETTPLDAVLSRAAEEEESPRTDLGRFFIELKRMTVDGYYTSQLGIGEEMRYEGNQHLTSAPQCNHPEHGAG